MVFEKRFCCTYLHMQLFSFSYGIPSVVGAIQQSPCGLSPTSFSNVWQQGNKIFKRNLISSIQCEFATYRRVYFRSAMDCHICGFELGADLVSEHCHLTRKYSSATQNQCNFKNIFTGLIPVILHNLSGYDSHVIMQGLTIVLTFYEKQLGIYCCNLSKKEI